MLVIRREQMEAFRRAAVARFERDLVAELRAQYPLPAARLGPDGLLALVRGAIQRGAGYGITAERDVATLAELDLDLGAPFERQKGCDWAIRILADKSLSSRARLTAILDRLPPAAA